MACKHMHGARNLHFSWICSQTWVMLPVFLHCIITGPLRKSYTSFSWSILSWNNESVFFFPVRIRLSCRWLLQLWTLHVQRLMYCLWQLQEFQLALVRRDDVIRTLSGNLRTMTENRDTLQAEYMTGASQLVEQVQILQDQLKQVYLQHHRYTG